MDYLSLLLRIVVHETNRSITELAIVQQFPQQQLSGVAGSINQNAPAVSGAHRRQDLAEESKRDAAAGQEQQHYQCINHEDSSREALEAKLEQHNHHADERPGRHCFRKRHQIVHARVTPDAAIDTKEQKRRQPHDHQHRQRSQKKFPCRAVRERLELDGVSRPVGKDN